MSSSDRVIVLVDMDCFYCQVEEKLNPKLKGKPIAVVQYNQWRGGGIIAVNYPARDRGVTRHMRGHEAQQKCPDIVLCKVPQVRGKADLNKYRNAGCEVAEVLQKFSPLLERASVDEAYLDVTEEVEKRINSNGIDELKPENLQNTFVVGYDNIKDFLGNVGDCNIEGLKLAMGALIAEEMRKAVLDQTGYKCSAGIGHNKIVAKLVSGLHKPNKQTVIPQESIPKFFETIPLSKIQGLGGKFGKHVADKLGIKFVGELVNFSEKELIKNFEKNGTWLYNIGKGTAYEPITTRLISQSVGCSKRFPGVSALKTQDSVTHWVGELSQEISERLNKDLKENNRKAKQIIVSFTHEVGRKDISSSKTLTLNSYEDKKIANQVMEVLKKFCLRTDGSYAIKLLQMSAGNFESIKKVIDIVSFFKANGLKANTTNSNDASSGKVENIINSNQGNVVLETEKVEEKKEVILEEGKQTNDIPSFFKKYCERLKENRKRKHPDNSDGEENLDESDQKNPTGRSKNNSSLLDDAIQDVSVYSATTEEMFEESNFLDFYSPSKERATEENNATSSALNNIETEQTQSFFKHYLEKLSEEKVDNKIEMNIDNEKSNWKQLCEECNEMISIFEFDSHKDYHFALKLKDETEEKRETNKNTLLSYLEKDEKDSNEKFKCDECGKMINVEEMDSHKDYHVAKRLHLELNQNVVNNKPPPPPPPPPPSQVQAKGKSKKGQKIANNSIQSVKSYFKPI